MIRLECSLCGADWISVPLEEVESARAAQTECLECGEALAPEMWTVYPVSPAYTVGVEAQYDASMAERAAEGRVLRKVGRIDAALDLPEEYPGGSVWRTPAEAAAYLQESGQDAYAVYEVALVGTWESDTEARADAPWSDLLVSAPIVRKVAP